MKVVEHRGKPIAITINEKICVGTQGETVLEIARREDFYIPTMCYLTKVSPIASCRLCVVKVKDVDGLILSCQEKAVDGAVITTSNEEIERHRVNIMKLYNVNHPLECGVCDKSGECSLQDKTLEFGVSSQEFSVKEQPRELKKWGILGYDPYLCIMCEKCVHTCNEVIGATALYIKAGGYKSTIDIKFDRCEQCGDCISVCPVGALISNEYKYSSNAWEANQIPATCSHCSGGCGLYYDVKHGTVSNPNESKITRVKNDFEFSTLCGAGRFAFSFENRGVANSRKEFEDALQKLKNANSIRFNSYITNEEALILQKLKQKLGLKLVNSSAKAYQTFLRVYSSVTKKSLYSATSNTVSSSDIIIMVGVRVVNDHPGIKYHVNMALKKRKSEFIYMHPIDDIALHDKYTQFIEYEVGSEEIILAMLAYYLMDSIPDEHREYFNRLNIEHLCAKSSTYRDDFGLISSKLARRKNRTLIIGSDMYSHKNATNIAKLIGLIERYSDFTVMLAPPQTNSLGVSLLCDLDDECVGSVVGYNEYGDFKISSDGRGDFNTPSLNQQEGTFTSLDLRVVNTNTALSFNGYCLNDLANEILDKKQQHTINYTPLLADNNEFKQIEFDDLKNGYDRHGNDLRGYKLAPKEIKIQKITLDEISEPCFYDDSVVYRCEPLNQFNKSTAKSLLLQSDSHLRGSSLFATTANIEDGDMVNIEYSNQITTKQFIVDRAIKGTIALYPTFDTELNRDLISVGYRYKQVKIKRVNQRIQLNSLD